MTALIQRGLEIVPGYTLVRRLGSGMAGEVWVARASGGVYVAIKIIRDMGMIGSKRELGALRIVREVKHTNLCPLIGVWFFDGQGELLSNAATDDILGRESSLIDTECLSAGKRPDDLRETHEITGEGGTTSPDESGMSGGENQAKELEGFDPAATIDRSDAVFRTPPILPPQRPVETDSDHTSSSDFRFSDARSGTESGPRRSAGLRRSDGDLDSPLGDAKQMIIAMGLGEKTLHDRLVEMRAPGNAPETDDDPLHLPGGVPAPELLRYITGAASAIDELNFKHNIYHCDIKPQNILIVGGNAQVCDFGLARRIHESRRTQLAIGTPAYGAPEMLFDQTYTKTIDQYSLAITYYEMRTGKLPFETSRRSSFLRAKANGELRLDDLPVPERVVIERATRLDPDERYPSCGEFADALAAAVYAKATPDTGRSRRLAITAMLVAGTAVGGSFATYRMFVSAPRESIAADPPKEPSDDSLVVSPPRKNDPILIPSKNDIPESPAPDGKQPDVLGATSADPVTATTEILSDMAVASAKADLSAIMDSVPPKVEMGPAEIEHTRRETDSSRTEKMSLEEITQPAVTETDPPKTLPPKLLPPAELEAIRKRLADEDESLPLDVLKNWQTELAEAAKLSDSATRSNVIAETQMLILCSLQEHFEPLSGRTPEAASSLGRFATTIIQNLDEQASDQKNAWQRIEGGLSAKARVAAGIFAWRQNRISDALRHWIDASKEKTIATAVPIDWRLDVSTKCLDWLVENAKVDDRNIQAIRYADSLKLPTGILDLVERFCSDSPELRRRIEPERFLLAIAGNDFRGGIDRWNSMQITPSDSRATPQLGYAYWHGISSELKSQTDRDQRIALIGALVSACVMQLDTPDMPREKTGTTKNPVELFQRLGETIEKIAEVTERPANGLPIVPQKLNGPALGVVCQRYVEAITAGEPPQGETALLERFDKTELVAAIAAENNNDSPTRDRLYLIAAEAFVQSRYEEPDDRPASEVVGRLYELDRATRRVDSDRLTPERTFLIARVADQKGFLARVNAEILTEYQAAEDGYTRVIDHPEAPDDLRGSAFRCRASLRSRIAAFEQPPRQRELLDLAAKDAADAIALPPRWHADTDDRFNTAAEVNISMARLIPDLDLATKQKLLDDADRYLDEAITVRKQLGYSTYSQETNRLNGYLFDLLISPKGLRRSDREQRAMTLMSQVATRPITTGDAEGVEKTIGSTSVGVTTHWHSMCAMVHHLASHPETALSHIRYALNMATKHLPTNNDRRHRATLIYVQLRGNELLQAIEAKRRPDPKLIEELTRLLDTIVDPNPQFQREKQAYLRDLQKMR